MYRKSDIVGCLALAGCLTVCLSAVNSALAAPPFYDRWETFDVTNGLPSNKAMCVLATSSAIWVGTDHGLARFKDGQWRTYTARDGLAHEAVMAIAEDESTGDLWIATMGGLNRFSAGRFDTFTQLSSGLVNDVVYGVTVHDGEVWAATAAGTSRYEIARDRWTIFNESNTPMHEIWCYSVTSCADVIYLAVWGGGLLEYRREGRRWKDYRDPDGEMEIDLFRNDGLVHDVVASVACEDALPIWIATYFGLSTYDGRRWKNFMEHDSPLVSNFINFVDTQGSLGWIATDNGLNATDRRHWWTYRRDEKTGRGEVVWTPEGGAVERFTTDTIFPHNYILGISFQAGEIWLATEKGVARGTVSNKSKVRSASVRPSARKVTSAK